MKFGNSTFQEINHIYDQTRMHNDQLLQNRFREIFEKIPEIKSLHDQLVDLSITQAKKELLYPEQFSSATSKKSFQEKVDGFIQQKKDLLTEHGYSADYLSPIYTCPDCKDTGFINGKPCHCLKTRWTSLIYEESNLKNILQKENFSTFNFSYYDDTRPISENGLTARGNMKKIYRTCQTFVHQFDDHYQNLFFYGPTGVGKTFLTHCIAKELLDSGHIVIYLTSIQLFDILENGKFKKDDRETFYGELEHLINSDLLIIDDLGTELTNAFTNSQLYYFIEERHCRRRSTIISTNLSLQELRDRYSERIFSRFAGYYQFSKLAGNDIRITNF